MFVLAQRQPPRDTGTKWPCSLRITELQLGDVSQKFFFTGHAAEVKTEHLERTLGRLAAGPKTDKQAGDDHQVDLNGHSVLAVREQMPAAENAF